MASALKIKARQLKVMPTTRNSGQANNSFQLWVMPRAAITPKMAVTVNTALKAAHSISASNTSSKRTGAFKMPSNVFCT